MGDAVGAGFDVRKLSGRTTACSCDTGSICLGRRSPCQATAASDEIVDCAPTEPDAASPASWPLRTTVAPVTPAPTRVARTRTLNWVMVAVCYECADSTSGDHDQFPGNGECQRGYFDNLARGIAVCVPRPAKQRPIALASRSRGRSVNRPLRRPIPVMAAC